MLASDRERAIDMAMLLELEGLELRAIEGGVVEAAIDPAEARPEEWLAAGEDGPEAEGEKLR